MKFLVFVVSSLTVAHCGYHHSSNHDDEDTVHVEHHEGATSYQNIHMEHFHPVPTYIKKEDKHWLEHPVSIGSSSSKVEIHHGGKHDHGYAIASVENDLHGHSLGDGGGGGEYRSHVEGGGHYGGDVGGGGEYGGDVEGGQSYGHQGHSEGYSEDNGGGQESTGGSSYEVHDQGGEYSHYQGQDVTQDAALGQSYESHYAQLAAAALAAHQGGGIPAAAGFAHHHHHNHNYHAQE